MRRSILLTSTFVVSCIVYLFSVNAWIFLNSFSNLVEKWGHLSEMTVYLRPEVSVNQIEKLNSLFKNYEKTVTAKLQSPDEIRNSINKLMPKSKQDFSGNEEFVAAIPPHFIVSASSNLYGKRLFDFFDTLSKELKQFPFVESTNFGKSWIEKYAILLQSFSKANTLFLLGLTFTLILVIGNAIRAHINSKREEIEILELVGATPAMIRRPFLLEGVLLSTLAMLFALVCSTLLIWLLQTSNFEIFKLLDLRSLIHEMSMIEYLLWLSLAIGIGFIGSHLCLSEINNGWSSIKTKKFITTKIHSLFGFKNEPSV